MSTLPTDPESPSMKAGDFVWLANQKGQDGNRFASPSHILNPSAEWTESEETKKEKVYFEGEMMRKAKENKLKKYYYILNEKELYVYKKKADKSHKTMVNLVGVFIRVDEDEPLDKKNILYPISLIFPNKTR